MSCAVCALFDGVTFRQLTLWERPAATGVVVGSVAATLVLLGYFEYTLVTLACRALQLAAAAWFAAVQLGRAPTVKGDEIASTVSGALTRAEPLVTAALTAIYELVSWQDTRKSAKAFAASLFLAAIGNAFSDLTLLFLVTVATFGWPPVYAKNKPAIDQAATKAIKKINETIDRVPALSALRQDSAAAKKKA